MLIDLRRVFALTAALLAASTATATAQSPAGTFVELGSTLKPGQRVSVKGLDGDTVKGKIIDISPSSLTLRVNEGFVDQPRTIDRQDVAAIRRTDSVWNGLLIGIGAGFAATAVWVRQICGPRGSDDECAAIASGVGWMTMPATGGAVGALIDRFIGNQLIYQAPGTRTTLRIAPIVAPTGRGLAVSLAF